MTCSTFIYVYKVIHKLIPHAENVFRVRQTEIKMAQSASETQHTVGTDLLGPPTPNTVMNQPVKQLIDNEKTNADMLPVNLQYAHLCLGSTSFTNGLGLLQIREHRKCIRSLLWVAD